MKKILVLLFALLLAAPLFSQVKFGLKAGVSTDFTFTNLDLSQANVDVVLEKDGFLFFPVHRSTRLDRYTRVFVQFERVMVLDR